MLIKRRIQEYFCKFQCFKEEQEKNVQENLWRKSLPYESSFYLEQNKNAFEKTLKIKMLNKENSGLKSFDVSMKLHRYILLFNF